MILLTGATGFTGSYILYELFRKKEKVLAVKRYDSSFRQIEFAFRLMNSDKSVTFDDYISYFKWVDADITDFIAMENLFSEIDSVMHCAAFVSFNKHEKQKVIETNVMSTSNLINLALQNNVKNFHFVSSIAALDRNSANISDESLFPVNKKFMSTYSHSKYLSEMEVWRAYAEGLQGVIINPGVILGPVLEQHSIAKVVNLIRKGFRFYTDGSNGYVDVRDVASFFCDLCVDEKYYQQRYILVSENVSYKELFSMMASAMNVNAPNIKAGAFIARLVAFFDKLRSIITDSEPVITKEMLSLISSRFYYDNSKVKNLTGKTFMPVAQSVIDMVNLIKE